MTARTVPGAASTWVAERVAGSLRRAEVLAWGPHAVYVDVDGDCIGVLARDAVAVPIGLRTTLERLTEVDGGVMVGDDMVVLQEYAVSVARIVDPSVPRLGALPPWPAPVRLDLPAPALRALSDAAASAVLDLLGRGDGLTPSGDDVLAGWLVTRHATERQSPSVIDEVMTHASARTTAMSATLLRRAVAGEAVPACRDLLVALSGRRDGHTVDAARDRLLAIGHTSGAAMALGVSLALENAA